MKKLFAFIAAALLSISVAQATPQPPQMDWGVAPFSNGYPLPAIQVNGGNFITFNVTHGFYPAWIIAVGGQYADAVNIQIDGINIVNNNNTLTLHVAATQPNGGNYVVGETIYIPYALYDLGCCNPAVKNMFMEGGIGRVIPTATVKSWDSTKRILVLTNVYAADAFKDPAFNLPGGKATIIGATSGAKYSSWDYTGDLLTAAIQGETTCSQTVIKRGADAKTWLTSFLTPGKNYSVVANSWRTTGSLWGPVILGDITVNGVSLKSLLISHGYDSTATEFTGCSSND